MLPKVDFIDTAIDSRFASVEYFPFSRGHRVACLECSLPPSVYQQLAHRYSCGWLKRIASEEKKIPTTIVTAAIAAAYATSLALRFGERCEARESRFQTMSAGSSIQRGAQECCGGKLAGSSAPHST